MRAIRLLGWSDGGTEASQGRRPETTIGRRRSSPADCSGAEHVSVEHASAARGSAARASGVHADEVLVGEGLEGPLGGLAAVTGTVDAAEGVFGHRLQVP